MTEKVWTSMTTLSEIVTMCPPLSGAKVVREGEVESLGYITHRHHSKTFLAYAGSKKFILAAANNRLVTAILTTPELAEFVPAGLGVLTCEDPFTAFFEAHIYLVTHTEFYWKNFENDIHPEAEISPHAIIAPRNVRIGKGSVIEAGVVIKERTIIGENSVICANCVVSNEGFEFKKLGDNLVFIPHGSGVRIGNNVRIHAGVKCDRGLFCDPTTVGNYTCVDSYSHVAHGVQLGNNVIVATSVVFAAAVIVKDGARVDPNATFSHEVMVGENAYVTLGSVVVSDVPDGQRVTGNFAMEHDKFMLNAMALRRGLKRE
jgi:UDP-3-O-[3-hydroxymyristoyl] glucosamine N-acyltransferase